MMENTTSEHEHLGVIEQSNYNKFLAGAYNLIGLAGGFITAFFLDHKIGSVLLFIYPLLAIVIVLFNKGQIELVTNRKNRLTNSLIIGQMSVAVFMCVRAYNDYSIFKPSEIWAPFIVVTVIAFGLFYWTAAMGRSEGYGKIDISLLIPFALVYGYGSTKIIDCSLDNSKPQTYKAIVLNKREYQGRKSTIDYFTLTPYGPKQINAEIAVDAGLYIRTKIGDTVQINFSKGLLNMPWFVVTK